MDVDMHMDMLNAKENAALNNFPLVAASLPRRPPPPFFLDASAREDCGLEA